MLSQKLETVYRTMRNDYYHILVVMLKAMTKFSLSCEHTHTTWEDRTDAASSSAYSRVPTIIITSNSMNGQGNVKNWYVIVIWFSRASSPHGSPANDRNSSTRKRIPMQHTWVPINHPLGAASSRGWLVQLEPLDIATPGDCCWYHVKHFIDQVTHP